MRMKTKNHDRFEDLTDAIIIVQHTLLTWKKNIYKHRNYGEEDLSPEKIFPSSKDLHQFE